MKLLQVVRAVPALTTLSTKELPFKVAYQLSKVLKTLQADLDFHNEKQKQIAQKYGVLNDDKTAYDIKSEYIQEAQSEITSLLELEVQVDLQPILIPLTSDITFSARDINLLEGFVEFQEV